MNGEHEFEATYGSDVDGPAQKEKRSVVGDDGVGLVGAPGAAATEAVVKWFRSDKGYGFVELAGGQGDAFLHLKALKAFGRETALTGAKLRVVVDKGPRGTQVTRVVDVDEPCAAPSAERPLFNGPRAFRRPIRDVSSAFDLTGRVKWFDSVRGFGFVASDDFGRDVFVHCSILEPADASRLAEGRIVTMRVIETPRGREAVSLSL